MFACLSLLLVTATACKKSAASTPNATGQTNQTNPTLSAEELKQQRLEWNLKTLVEPYEHAGHTNPKWDVSAALALTEFARTRANVVDTNEPWAEIISTNVAAAIRSGCDDPMLNYLFIKYAMKQTNSPKVFADAFSKTTQDMQESSYPSIRKFYACFRTAQQIQYAWGTNQVAEENHFWNLAITNLGMALWDKFMPVTEIDDACYEAADNLLLNTNERTTFYHQVELPLFDNWTNASVSWYLKGQYCIDFAWYKRGGGYANTVTAEGWKLFTDHLNEAEKSLAHAWELNPKNPRIPTKMITVELGQGKGRDRMELWFNRAMELDPNDYDACSAKLYYLEPKWYGSTEEMLEFGRECVTNQAWGGHISLILLDAHKSIQRQYVNDTEKNNYWKQPGIWPDLKSAFDRFFELNPDAVGWHHDYAYYAYQCQQWNEFLHQVSLFSTGTNYEYFGGKDEFDNMVQLATENAAKSQ
jgi:hypothetical protein